MTMNADELLISFVQKNGTNEFEPFAYYDKHLDCIRVRIRDCSVIEERLSRIFTLMIPAHSDPRFERPVGFVIKGIRYFCEELNLSEGGEIKLADIFDCIVKKYPDNFVKSIHEEFFNVIEDDKFSVEIQFDQEQGQEEVAA